MAKQSKIEMRVDGTFFVVVVGEFGQVDFSFGLGRGIECWGKLKPNETFADHLTKLEMRPPILTEAWATAIEDAVKTARSFMV